MTHQRAFYLRCAKSVAGDIKNVINPANDPEIAVLITPRAVASEVVSGELAPILFFIALLVAVNRAQHCRPRSTNNQFAANIRPDFVSLFIHNYRINTEERERRAAGLCWNRARQRRDQNRSGLGLPPRIDNRTTSAADILVVPHPCLRINRLADATEKPQR